MEREELNAAFEKFVNTGICREVQQDLRSLIWATFVAGWCAARYPAGPADKTDPPNGHTTV